MERPGKVKGHRGRLALVDLRPHETCADCGACLALTDKKSVLVEATDTVGAKEGDAVLVTFPTRGVLLSVFLLFVLPIMLALAGYLVASALTHRETYSVLAALAAFALAFVLAKLVDARLRAHPTIERIINKEETCRDVESKP